jgi:hypothetical protein
MNTTTARLAGFGLALVVILGAGAGLGSVVGPDVTKAAAEAPAPIGEGVVSAADGYRLIPLSTDLNPSGGAFRFRIERQNSEPVLGFTATHERLLHLVVVNRELTVFRHLHPTLDASGTWSIDLPPLEPGSYRAIADFWITGGPHLALGTDLSVSGAYRPTELLAEPSPVSTVDGYDVTLDTERGKGGVITVALTVRRNGTLVTDLEPYLGAFGHLIALRAGDLAYAHVHPIDRDGETEGVVRFDATLTSAGRYGLFFDFQHDGTVHTASFTFDQGAVTGTPKMEH